MTRDAMLLVNALRDPATTVGLDAQGWTTLMAMARAEQLIGTLAHRLNGVELPVKVATIMADARTNAEYQRRSALWEAECAARALSDYSGKVVLLKGTAYIAANLKAGEGRHIGDLDIMVARDDLPQVEALLLEKGGWEWVKEDAYDDAYYRDHMHELPPMIHKDRDRMIDVHHTILPLTAKPRPDAAAMLVDASSLAFRGGAGGGAAIGPTRERQPHPNPSPEGEGLYVLSPPDMIIHSAAHLFADGELAGGLRNLWDIHCLLPEMLDEVMDGNEPPDPVWVSDEATCRLLARADHHQLRPAVERAIRLASHLYGDRSEAVTLVDRLFIRRLTARDGWGRSTRKFTRLIFYIRSHWLRMPPAMLARHLWTKWRKA
jgi:Uncharacterised nucleotidyltransferase